MKIKGILFDYDGVIVKSMEIHYQAWQYVFNQFNVKINKHEFFKMEGTGIHNVGKTLIEKYKLNVELLPDLIDKKRRYYNKIDTFQLYKNLIPLLDFIKLRNILMAIVTGGSYKRVKTQVDKYLKGYFSGIITPEKVNTTKPSPEPYLKGADILGLLPTDCLVFENAPLGIHSGKEAGMKVIAIQTTLTKKYIQEADYIVKDFIQAKKLLEQILN